jgi:hypothetical protein
MANLMITLSEPKTTIFVEIFSFLFWLALFRPKSMIVAPITVGNDTKIPIAWRFFPIA